MGKGAEGSVIQGWPTIALALLVVAAVAFWPPYFSVIASLPGIRVHAHAAALFSWLALLVAQLVLLRTNRRSWHRCLGKLAYVLAPCVVLSSLALASERTRMIGGQVEDFRYSLLFTQLYTTALFGLAAGMAFWRRRQAAWHGRWMLATAVVMIDPVLARIWMFWITGLPLQADLVSYLLIDAFLSWLIWRERRAREGRRVFPTLLALLLLGQVLGFHIANFGPWRSFVEWFAR